MKYYWYQICDGKDLVSFANDFNLISTFQTILKLQKSVLFIEETLSILGMTLELCEVVDLQKAVVL